MNYMDQGKNPYRHVVGISLVVLFHIILIYALVNGLGQAIVDHIAAPIETKIIKEIKPPPPDAPPPPPPQLAAPPPPYIPPPEINVEQPTTTTNAITAVTHEAPPTQVVRPAAPVATAPAIPDREVSASPIGGSKPEAPEDVDENSTGKVLARCDIEADGRPDNCELLHVSGSPSYGRSVMTWLHSGTARYAPAVRNGVPIREPGHQLQVTFSAAE